MGIQLSRDPVEGPFFIHLPPQLLFLRPQLAEYRLADGAFFPCGLDPYHVPAILRDPQVIVELLGCFHFSVLSAGYGKAGKMKKEPHDGDRFQLPMKHKPLKEKRMFMRH